LCGFRVEADRDNEMDPVLYYGTNVGQQIRTLFQALFERILARRDFTVFRYAPVVCQRCGYRLERAVVRQRYEVGGQCAFWSECGNRLSLPKMDERIHLINARATERARSSAPDHRPTHALEQAIFRVLTYVREQRIKPPECCISYEWGEA
jgi:hypothetical protein